MVVAMRDWRPGPQGSCRHAASFLPQHPTGPCPPFDDLAVLDAARVLGDRQVDDRAHLGSNQSYRDASR